MVMFRTFILFLSLLHSSCTYDLECCDPSTPEQPEEPDCYGSSEASYDILFVGNSLTYSNEMPVLLEKIGEENDITITTECICYGNYALEDHINDGIVQTKISSKKYSHLVFQQGPSSQAYGRETLLEYGKQLSKLALENQATPAYLMVWPSIVYYHTFDGVIKNYSDAATANDALLIPLGIIWRKIHENHSQIKLYASDEFHPSRLGSLLEALVILKTLNPSLDIEKLTGKTFNEHFVKEADKAAFLQLVSTYINEL